MENFLALVKTITETPYERITQPAKNSVPAPSL
jgi:hypothetical protein